MREERFDALMHDAAETYHRPPEPPLDEMWSAIAAALDEETDSGATTPPRRGRDARPGRLWQQQWFRMAAALVIGVALGRVWTSLPRGNTQSAAPRIASRADSSPAGGSPERPSPSEPYDRATTAYLGQTAALLIALPNEVRAGRADPRFISRAGELLLTTRLLLDSPAASDPAMRNLLEDLELVLAQVVRLRDERGRAGLELINQALEQRDVMPRLQLAVADMSADDD